MKKFLLSLFVLVSMAVTGYSQTIVIVEPDEGLDIGALNDAVDADSSSVIYELRRGGTYYLDGKISTDWPLHIRAEEGEGERPILVPAIDENGESDRLFGLGGNTVLEGLYFTGLDELGNLNKNLIRVEVDGVKLEVDDCMFDYDRQATIRLNAEDISVFVTSCIFRNVMELNDPGDSKLIDTRGNQQDTIVFDDNTIYHMSDQFMRTDDGFLKYLRIDHNTIYLMGDAIKLNYTMEAVITNNIFYNINWQGSDTTGGSSEEAFLRLDSIGSDFAGFTDAGRTFTITNNNIYLEQKYIDAMSVPTDPQYHQAIFMDDVCEAFLAAGQMDTSMTIHEALEFDAPPEAPMDYVALFHANYGNLDAVDFGDITFYADKNPDVPGGEDDFSFNYSKDALSASGSTTGGRLGSSRWASPTGINDVFVTSRSAIKLSMYPNPVQNEVYIASNDMDASVVKVSFYTITGKEVKSMDINASRELIKVDLRDLPTGIYVCRVKFNNGNVGSNKISISR